MKTLDASNRNNGHYVAKLCRYSIFTMGLIAVLLSGCSAEQDPTLNELFTSITEVSYIDEDVYTISEFLVDNSKNLEHHEVYNNEISRVELVKTDRFYKSNELSLLNLSTGEVRIPDIEKEYDENRIWNFIELSDDKYLYTEIYFPDEYEHRIVKYKVFLQDSDHKTIITEGNSLTLLDLPMFSFRNDSIYFICASYEFNSLDNQNYGDLRIELWMINDDNYSCLYSDVGEYADYRTTEQSEFIKDNTVVVTDDSISFITGDAKHYYINTIKNGDIQKNIIEIRYDGFDHITFINDFYLATAWQYGETIDKDNLYSYLIDINKGYTKVNKPIRLESSCVLDEWTIGILDDTDAVAMRVVDNKIEIKKIPEIRYGSHMHKIDGNSLLVFTYSKYYRLDFK